MTRYLSALGLLLRHPWAAVGMIVRAQDREAEAEALRLELRGLGLALAEAYAETECYRTIAEALQSQASEGAEALAHRWLEMQRELRDLTEENTVLRSTVERLKRQRVVR